MQITIVKSDKGWVGRTASDRWNLSACGINGPIVADRNGSAVKRARRVVQSLGLTLKAAKADAVRITRIECDALGMGEECAGIKPGTPLAYLTYAA